MPLTVSFRCPQAVVESVQHIVPQIKAAKGGGILEDWDEPMASGEEGERDVEPWFVEDFELGSVVLCRNNAPLIKLGFGMIRAGIPCYFTGKDMAAQLSKIIKELPDFLESDPTALKSVLRDWYETERDRLEKRGLYALLDRHNDRYEALWAIMSGTQCKTKTQFIRGIEDLFQRQPSPNSIELSTVHKSKGKEWNTVYILNDHLIPGRWIKDAADNEIPGAKDLLQQEYNLRYVAYTRSLNKLVFFTLERDARVLSRKEQQ